MKKFFSILSIALIAAVGFTACSDDDDPTLADSAKGTYTVTVEATGVLPTPGPGTVILAKTGATTVDLKLEGFKLESLEIPVALKGATLTGTNDAIKITSTEQEVKVKIGETEIPVKVQITEGTILLSKTMAMKINVKGIPGVEGTAVINVTSRAK